MAKKKDQKPKATARDYQVIRKPVVTEKSSQAGGASVAVFQVERDATKPEIKQAVERIFSVDVVKVRTANYIGKQKRRGTSVGRTNAYRKAYVSLQEGQTIDLVEGL